MRDISVQAQYFRSTLDYNRYVTDNIFLADINNERPVKNATYYQVALRNFFEPARPHACLSELYHTQRFCHDHVGTDLLSLESSSFIHPFVTY